jgi:DNA-binding transcriptional regulator YbjK
MPPFNAQRRDRLADAAVELLAREGARGLTHRAVDAEAGEPAGTTSRYFRTREALMGAVVERVRTLHFADLRRALNGAVEPEAIADHLASMALAAVTVNRARHLAIAELFIEATRRPSLQPAMAATRTGQIQLMRNIHQAAGIELTPADAALLVTSITGIVQIALTTPEAIGVRSPDDVRGLVREVVDLVHRQPAGRRGLGHAAGNDEGLEPMPSMVVPAAGRTIHTTT